MRLLPTTLTLLAISLSLHSSGKCESKFKCGDEYRITTNDGTKIKGRLLSNDGDTLTLKSGTKVAVVDTKSVHNLKRHGLAGAMVGGLIGTVVGGSIAAQLPSRGLLDFRIGEKVAITLAGTFVLGISGAFIGHHRPSYKKVNIEILPLCSSPSGDVNQSVLRLTVNF